MITNGTLSIGEPCAPFNVTRYRTAPGGIIDTQEVTIYGRKNPLIEIRKQMLTHHEKYMRILTDVKISQMSEEDIRTQLTKQAINFDDGLQLKQLQQTLAKTQ